MAGRLSHTSLGCAQFAFNTLSRVSPVSHGVCNVVSIARAPRTWLHGMHDCNFHCMYVWVHVSRHCAELQLSPALLALQVKRVVIIGTSVVFFGTSLTTKTKMGGLHGPFWHF